MNTWCVQVDSLTSLKQLIYLSLSLSLSQQQHGSQRSFSCKDPLNHTHQHAGKQAQHQPQVIFLNPLTPKEFWKICIFGHFYELN